MNYIRTILFYFLWSLVTAFWITLILLMVVLPYRLRHRIARFWGHSTVYLAKFVAGIDWQIVNKENLINQPVIYAVNHQSTWETIFSVLIDPNQVWVMKKELVELPIFGWAMRLLRPIAIDRNNRKTAMTALIAEGRKRIDDGYSVCIFPEGHRFSPTAPLRFHSGAARMAVELNVPIIPIAHNAGQFWPRRGWLHDGQIQVVIGKPIYPNGQSATELNKQIENWVRNARDHIVQRELAIRQKS